MLIDTHAHLNIDDNIASYIEAMDNGIIIVSGTNLESNKGVLEIANKYPNVYATLGIHPEYVNSYREEDIKFIIDNIDNPKVVGIGEVGLDYHYDENRDKQKELFLKMIDIAKKNNKPLVIHVRDAYDDALTILKGNLGNNKALLHCYGGSLEMAKEFIKLGIKLGIGGVLTFKNGKKLQEVVANLDISNFVLETDSPYLSPEPLRGTVNNPSNVKYVAQKMTELKNLSFKQVADITSNNAKALFDFNI